MYRYAIKSEKKEREERERERYEENHIDEMKWLNKRWKRRKDWWVS